MRSGRSIVGIFGGCAMLLILAVLAIPAFLFFSATPGLTSQPTSAPVQATLEDPATQIAVPTLTVAPATPIIEATAPAIEAPDASTVPELASLYEAVSPGVVSIQVFVAERGATGLVGGSGFVLDEQGHIITNHHVVAGAQAITVVFYNGLEVAAELVGADLNSDLAVLRVDSLPEGAHPLVVGDSSAVRVGEWVVAIGNPFGVGTSMSVGIVSAVGRIIEGLTIFSIPEAIQTDAAINPGNSGGPLLNLAGEVVGVNAQIATAGERASAGVGFAIPANTVRRVAPVLIEAGVYRWPWLGVRGQNVNLLLSQVNDLAAQAGGYIHEVVPGSPADRAGLRGSTGETRVGGIEVPVGGDVVIGVNGEAIADYTALLVAISSRHPGDEMLLTVLREGQELQLTAVLEPRPGNQP